MSLHYPGYQKALDKVETMTETEMYRLCDSLFGRDNLPCNPTIEDLRNEARAQLDKEWTDTTSEEYERLQSWKPVIEAMVKSQWR